MYCYRCGRKLLSRSSTCPYCDTPQKRRSNYRRRMILGLLIFITGGIIGSLSDTVFFKGKAWNHSFFGAFEIEEEDKISNQKTENNQFALLDESTSRADKADKVDKADSPDVFEEATEADYDASFPEDCDEYDDDNDNEDADEADYLDEQIIDEQQAQSQKTMLPLSHRGKLVYDSVQTLEEGANSSYHAYVSANSELMVFASDRHKVAGKKLFQCFIRDFLSSSDAKLEFEWKGNVWTPEITPDLKTIVFSSDKDAVEHIYIYDRNTKKVTQLTEGKTKNMMSSISPDGSQIVFVSDMGGSNHIWIKNLDDSAPIQITNSKYDDREPRWSFDGRSIFFTRIYEHLKRSDIMKVELDPMTEPIAVVSNSARNWLASLSPCGSLLAYTRTESSTGGANTIFIRELDTGKESPIKPLGATEYFRPVWLYDSSGFVFHTNVGVDRSIHFARFRPE